MMMREEREEWSDPAMKTLARKSLWQQNYEKEINLN